MAKKESTENNKKKRDPRGLKKGQTNNRKGPPHAWETYKGLLNRYNLHSYQKLAEIDIGSIPAKHAIVIKAIMSQLENDTLDPRIISWMSDREDGKVKEEIEMTTESRNVLSFAEAAKKKK